MGESVFVRWWVDHFHTRSSGVKLLQVIQCFVCSATCTTLIPESPREAFDHQSSTFLRAPLILFTRGYHQSASLFLPLSLPTLLLTLLLRCGGRNPWVHRLRLLTAVLRQASDVFLLSEEEASKRLVQEVRLLNLSQPAVFDPKNEKKTKNSGGDGR